MKMVNLLVKYALARLGGAVTNVTAPIGPYVKQLTLGVALTFVGIQCFILTILFLMISLFFACAHLGNLGIAGLWTSLVTAVLGGVIVGIGLSFLQKPYPGRT
jgi:chromate transport protein ChrA